MGAGVRSWLSKPHVLRTLLSQARLAFRLIREPAVSTFAKAIPFLGVLYLVDPIDFVPDVIPLLGQLDDLGIALAALEMFLACCPRAAKAFHEAAIAQARSYSPMPSGSSGQRTAASGQRPADTGQRPAADVIDAEWRRD